MLPAVIVLLLVVGAAVALLVWVGRRSKDRPTSGASDSSHLPLFMSAAGPDHQHSSDCGHGNSAGGDSARGGGDGGAGGDGGGGAGD